MKTILEKHQVAVRSPPPLIKYRVYRSTLNDSLNATYSALIRLAATAHTLDLTGPGAPSGSVAAAGLIAVHSLMEQNVGGRVANI